ncbi:hypothetical protein DPMN_083255 [Dreissena polymorpha]|uniref:Uncharacterized protein n=1 Tax=Dreissena polymorpha TaxID=45954 RepID=A0A9D4BAX9_DREPO|nr:hypothetical protein DPMN_083255 [Dreissena polymorpha]
MLFTVRGLAFNTEKKFQTYSYSKHRHSAAVDRAVSRRLSESETQHDRELVQEFLNLYVLSVPHQLVTDSETSLVLSLNHRLASVREKAVTTLIASRAEV